MKLFTLSQISIIMEMAALKKYLWNAIQAKYLSIENWPWEINLKKCLHKWNFPFRLKIVGKISFFADLTFTCKYFKYE